jgi:hypothetical protein
MKRLEGYVGMIKFFIKKVLIRIDMDVEDLLKEKIKIVFAPVKSSKQK